VTTFTENTHIEVKLELPRESVTVSPERIVVIYRVVQEALTNIAKHAGARLVEVSLTATNQQLQAIIHDDGRGFAPESLPAHTLRRAESVRGVGLFGMEERARLAGGALKIRSAPGEGTTVTLIVPLDRPEHTASAKTTSGTYSIPPALHDPQTWGQSTSTVTPQDEAIR